MSSIQSRTTGVTASRSAASTATVTINSISVKPPVLRGNATGIAMFSTPSRA